MMPITALLRRSYLSFFIHHSNGRMRKKISIRLNGAMKTFSSGALTKPRVCVTMSKSLDSHGRSIPFEQIAPYTHQLRCR